MVDITYDPSRIALSPRVPQTFRKYFMRCYPELVGIWADGVVQALY